MSGHEQQIFFPDMPNFGPGTGVDEEEDGDTSGLVWVVSPSGGSGLESDVPMLCRRVNLEVGGWSGVEGTRVLSILSQQTFPNPEIDSRLYILRNPPEETRKQQKKLKN